MQKFDNDSTCVNCKSSNETFETSYNTSHHLTDVKNCEVLRIKIRKSINLTNYHRQPVWPKFIDNISRLLAKPTLANRPELQKQSDMSSSKTFVNTNFKSE